MGRIHWCWVNDIKNINWKICRRVYKKLTFSKQKRLAKHNADQFATGVNMVRWKFKEKDTCSRYNQKGEDKDHMLTCKDKRAEEQFNTSVKHVKSWMTSVKTDPDIILAIELALNNIRKPPRPPKPKLKKKVREAYHHQRKLGFTNMTLGFVLPLWGETQQKYLEKLKKRNTGKTWLIALIKKLWLVSWDMWDNRNGVLHGKENKEALAAEHAALNKRIEDQYTKGSAGLR